MTQRGGLGRGLSALIPGAEEEGGLVDVPVQAVTPNPRQPRQSFPEDQLEPLARSIREVGILQPIVVRRVNGGYELVAGERRLRAAKIAGLATIPAIIRSTDDAESLREALIENIHRQDLGPLELASAFQELQEDLGVTQEALAERLGHSRPHVANTIRLLGLPAQVQQLLADGSLSAGHGRALLALEDDEAKTALAQRIVGEGLSVRQTEGMVQSYSSHPSRRAAGPPPRERDPKLLQIEEALGDALETRVHIQRAKRKGRIVIDFGSKQDLDRIAKRILGRGRKP
ncbi:MAG TPA: ParB/RepB/Spo0J family partition protein [Actinomycetota bacterium]|nr:ParB/RepB/Spo0J family partition protein [Actinomycetota bacterium]